MKTILTLVAAVSLAQPGAGLLAAETPPQPGRIVRLSVGETLALEELLVWDTPFAPGPQKPRVFAEGLAIPLGVLPYKNGVYVQHGTEIVFLSDTDGEVVDGLLVSQDQEAILLRRPNSEDQRIPHGQVRSATYTKMSMMPEGLLDPLKPEEVADLFAYLKILK